LAVTQCCIGPELLQPHLNQAILTTKRQYELQGTSRSEALGQPRQQTVVQLTACMVSLQIRHMAGFSWQPRVLLSRHWCVDLSTTVGQ
jgi:hypothetical protein